MEKNKKTKQNRNKQIITERRRSINVSTITTSLLQYYAEQKHHAQHTYNAID